MKSDTRHSTLPPVRSILTGTDFSEIAEHGVAAASRLASATGATLHVVHSVDLSYTGSTMIGMTAEFLDGLQASAQEKLERSIEKHTRDGIDAIEVDLRIRNGSAADVLLEEADAVDASLIVIATHARTGLAHALLGSTAEHVLQRTARPVLSLHRADVLPALPPRKILIPSDLSGDAALAFEGSRRLLGATPGATEIHLLHAVEIPGDYGRNVAAESWTRMLDKLEKHARERLAAIAEEIGREGFEVRTTVRLGSASELILEEALSSEPDLIAMRTAERSTLGRLFLGSTARRIVQRADCPVLTIRWTEHEA